MCQWHTQQKTAAECATQFLNTGKISQYKEELMKEESQVVIDSRKSIDNQIDTMTSS